MTTHPTARYRFYFISPFHVSDDSPYSMAAPAHLPREERMMNYDLLDFGRLLDDVEWELDRGPRAPYGDWLVENREEFELVGAGVLPIVRQAAASGEWDAIVLLGGGEPGVMAAREIGKRHDVPVVSVALAQMTVATMLGNKFSVIDLADNHSMYYRNLVVQHHMASRCASIRVIDFPLPRPDHPDERNIGRERTKALAGEHSDAVTEAIDAACAAVEDDGAEVITFGCSLTFWLKPFVRDGLRERGWDVPVLEGYSCAISQAKTMVDLGVDASGLAFPADRPAQLRRRKIF